LRVRCHRRQQALDQKRAEGRSDLRTRQHLMERSFARAKRYGYDQARWRGLWRKQIQELLTCAVQNIQVLVARTGSRLSTQTVRIGSELRSTSVATGRLLLWLPDLRNGPT
jgi:Tfp pilus assembly protein PilE